MAGKTRMQRKRPEAIVSVYTALAFIGVSAHRTTGFTAPIRIRRPVDLLSVHPISRSSLSVSSVSEDVERLAREAETGSISESSLSVVADTASSEKDDALFGFLDGLKDKIGTVDESRLLFPEYKSGEVPRMFSSLEYVRNGDSDVTSRHAAGSVLGAVALIAGTTVGAGVLALPSATAAAGFIPSTFAMISAYIYMTISGLLIAELTLNRMAQTGKPGMGLLDLYESSMGKVGGIVGTSAYFFLHYALMVAYLAQGGKTIELMFGLDQNGSVAFAAVMSAFLFAASPNVVEKVNNVVVFGVVASLLSIIGVGAGTADFGALIAGANQHPDQVISCFPILFLALVYQNVVPTVVANLEGDKSKITKAIVGGTTLPFLMYLAWNAVCLGNALASGADLNQVDPVALLQAGEMGGAVLVPLVNTFSLLAIVSSIVGFTYGLVDAWTDKFQIPLKSKKYESKKPALFGLVFIPPLVLAMADPDIFYRALEFGGAFGVSTLFLVLPPLMVWKERYGDTEKPLMTGPMVPLGKIPLASMWKAAGTLIIEQGAEKLGVFEWVGHHWEEWATGFSAMT